MSETIDTKAKVYDILKGFSTAMVVTHGLDGKHGARPMHVAQLDEKTGQVSFLTGPGRLVQEIKKESPVLMVFEDENSSYLSVRGEASARSDSGKVKELWHEAYKVWFPKGPEDPSIEVVTVNMADAEYWDNRGLKKLQYVFESATAYFKGEKPVVNDPDQHGKAKL